MSSTSTNSEVSFTKMLAEASGWVSERIRRQPMAPASREREKCALADRRAVSNGLREAREEHVFGFFLDDDLWTHQEQNRLFTLGLLAVGERTG